MSTNARTWFYKEPEHNTFLISERLNGTFWQARFLRFYWRCTRAEPPFQAEGFDGGKRVVMEWEPNKWLSVTLPGDVEAKPLVEAMSRVLGRPASLTYGTAEGSQVYEWHLDGGQERWREIQGKPAYVRPRRLQS